MAQQKLQQAAKELEDVQMQLRDHRTSKSQLVTQELENKQVLEELSKLEADAIVYKMIGAVLVKQPIESAVSVVRKRLEYIAREVEKAERLGNKLENDMRSAVIKVEGIRRQISESQK